MAIISYSNEPKVIENLFENITNKNNNLRAKCAMYIGFILGSWPEYIIEKYLGNQDGANNSMKGKSKLGAKPKSRGGARSKQRVLVDGAGMKSAEQVENFEEFLKIALSDANPECRHHARQAFLTFYEIWPEESDSLIVQFRGMFSKHKEIIDKLGSHLTSAGTQASSAKLEENKISRRRIDDRKTQKVLGNGKNFLNPTTENNRRTDTTPKSQNRMNAKNKFLSEERQPKEETKGSEPYQAISSSGFRNLRPTNYSNNSNNQNVYVSKYQNTRIEPIYKKRSVSKDVVGTYKSSGLAANPKLDLGESPKKFAHEEDLMELDEKCQDISEIEIDPEDGKEETLYPKPYQGFMPSKKLSPEEEIADLIK